MIRPTVLVTGDCQALDIATAAIRIPALNERFEFVHLNGAGYGQKQEYPTPNQAARAAVHWRQDTDASPPGVDGLTGALPRFTFPTLALGLYLPFQVFDAQRPANTWLGDRVLIALDEQGAPVDEIPEAYYEMSCEQTPKLWRLGGAQVTLLQQAEQACDVKPSRFMSTQMYRRRLFWDFDHAGPPTIGWLLGELAALTWPDDKAMLAGVKDALTAPETLLNPHPWQAPIGRMVREQLELDWVTPDARYAWHGETLTEDEYLKLYVSDRRKLRQPTTH